MNKEFSKNTLFSVAGFGLMMLFSFVFTYFAARKLGAAGYGVFMSFFYFLITFTQPINSLQLAAAKLVANRNMDLREGVRYVSPTLFAASLLTVALFAAMSFVLKPLLHLDSIWTAMLGGLVVALWLVQAGYRGVYQGRMSFFAYGANYAAEGFFRAASGIAFLFAGLGVMAAVGSSAIGAVLAILLLAAPFLGAVFSRLSLKADRDLMIEFLKALAVLLPFGLIMNLDLLVVQNVIGGETSGYVSACAQFGKNLVSLSMMIANVVFSYTVRRESGVFWKGLALVAAVFAGAALAVVPFSKWLVGFLFGAGYEPVVKLLPLYIAATLPVGVLQYAANNVIASDDKRLKPAFAILLGLLVPLYWLGVKRLSLAGFYVYGAGLLAAADVVLVILHRKHLSPDVKKGY